MDAESKFTIDTFRSITGAIGGTDSLDSMTSLLTQLLVTRLGIKGCIIFFLNPDAGELEILSSFGLSPGYLTKGPVSAFKSIGDILEGGPAVVTDVGKDTSLQYPEEAKKEGIRTIVSVPIIFSKQTMGVLRLYHHEVWEISEEDLASLHILAEVIGLALSYTRLLYAVQAIAETTKTVLAPTANAA
jgi:signal transduction protein with GAF and PtsI domain